MVEKYFDQEDTFKMKAIYELVSDKAGECEAIPPEEWGATFDFEFEDCQDQVVRKSWANHEQVVNKS